MAASSLERVDRPYDVIALEARNMTNEKLLSHVNSQVLECYHLLPFCSQFNVYVMACVCENYKFGTSNAACLRSFVITCRKTPRCCYILSYGNTKLSML